MFDRLQHIVEDRIDVASLVVFRVMFGVMAAIGAVRYLAYGWVDQLFVEPSYFFTYLGFDWVQPLPAPWMHLAFVVLAALGVMIALGWHYRISISAYFLLFTYVELIDKTNYLNHYYFVSLVAFLMIFMPLGRAGSIDAWRAPEKRVDAFPAWVLWTLRLQLGLVYVFAGIAKLHPEWLLNAEPLTIWLAARADFPVVGALFDQAWLPYVMAWAGAIFDLTIVGFLLWKKSRPLAYVAVVGFHVATGLLFNIGLFPLIMIGLTPIFFAPDWPRRFLSIRWNTPSLIPESDDRQGRLHRPRSGRLIAAALVVWFTVQIAVPLRHLAYPGDVLWNQEGWRFSWRVMLIEKAGYFKYQVRDRESGKRWTIRPEDWLTERQMQLASGSPDMILQLAHDIGDRFRERGYESVVVHVDSWASLNASESRRLVDPTVDLLSVERGLSRWDWVTESDSAPRISDTARANVGGLQ